MDDLKKAFAYALGLLARRDRSMLEMERKLRDRSYPAGVCGEVIDCLTKSGYLDDRRFAERWAESAVRNGRGYGQRLRLELLRKGIDREIVTEVVAGVTAAYDELETLSGLVSGKFAGFDPETASDREKRRVVAYLQRRGFSMAAIFNLLNDRDGFRSVSE